ncbi:UNVERIFIED_CONTAM: hypothetical protein NCL1_00740 [Trichonephila clavipes]
MADQIPQRLGVACRPRDFRRDEMAGRGCGPWPPAVPRSDAAAVGAGRGALFRAARFPDRRVPDRAGPASGAGAAPCQLAGRRAGLRPSGASGGGLAAGGAGGCELSLPSAVRAVGKRHGHAGLGCHRGATGRGAGHSAGYRRLPVSMGRYGVAPGSRSHADRAGFRLSGADPVPVRLRCHVGAGGDDHLCHAAHGADHHSGPARRAGRNCRGRAHVGLHPAPEPVEGAAACGAGHADGWRQSGDHADAEHGHHRLDDRGGGLGLSGADRAAQAGRGRGGRGRFRHRHPCRGAGQAEPGHRAPWPGGAGTGGLDRPPPAQPCASGGAAGQLPAGRAAARAEQLSRKLAAQHRQLLAGDRGGESLCPDLGSGAGEAVPAGHSVGLGAGAGLCDSCEDRGLAAGADGPCHGQLHRGQRALARGDDHALPLRRLRRHRHADRRAAGRLGRTERAGQCPAHAGHRHASDPADLRLSDPGGHAVPGR